ncbi:MAG TPA: Rne/Rng family ribonuclease [Streptosporangiaceae bacterium]|nr:Rne/Rng family ribonuclease [Streptosporangiaceae bacterium]
MERHNAESEPDDPAAAGQEAGGQRRGLFRRGRKAVTRPAGPPSDEAGAAEEQGGPATPGSASREPAGTASASTAPASTGPARTGPARTGPASTGPARTDREPAGDPALAVPPVPFQPPVVIFQPPEIAAPAAGGNDSGRQQASDSGPDKPAGGETRSSSRRRNSPRGGAASDPAESGDGPDKAGRGRDRPAGDGQADQHRPGGESQAAADQDGDAEQVAAAGKRRRRGGRGKGRGEGDAAGSGPDAAGPEGDTAGGRAGGAPAAAGSGGDAAENGDDDGEAGDGGRAARRRRRRRRSGPGGDGDAIAADDPPDTVVHVRPPRQADSDDVRSIKGSTRLEAKRQRRREGRDSGRRRPPVITESEFLARREAVERVMVVRQTGDRTQIAVLEDSVLVEHYVDKASHQFYVGNVYLGKVQNVLPSMEAAFVDIGKGRNAVLYAGEVNFDASGLEGESKRIESALKSGQSILVQVTKDPIGHKGARLTSQVSLPGRYLVYVPGSSMTGISRKLPDIERSRLKQILRKVMPENAGVIVRTAAEGASEEELARDVARLAAQWEAIERKARTATAPELLYSEPDLTIRVVRDIFNEDFIKLVIASDSDWDLVDEYVRFVAPTLADRLERWASDEDVFAAYRVDEQLAKALERKVWLPSGGSLVIDATEAMTVIDVNTGKFTGQGGNLEQTVTRNNLEAAEEIVRQLRLRDVGGIIVIDFIDMVLESNRELVLRRLLECLARDRTKHQVAEVTSLGLVQMTRKRVGSGLLEAFSVPCEHCNGRGVIISLEPVDHSPPRGRAGDSDRNGKDDGRARSGGQTGDDAGGPQRSRSSRSRSGRARTADPLAAGAAADADDNAASPGGEPPVGSGALDDQVGPGAGRTGESGSGGGGAADGASRDSVEGTGGDASAGDASAADAGAADGRQPDAPAAEPAAL